MRKLLLSIAGMFLCLMLMAQTPAAFKYQAVARYSSGEVMADKTMNVRIGIFKGIAMEYSEIHTVTTNEYGLFSIEVGRGSPEMGNFFEVAWNEDPHFLRIEVDPNGNNNYMYLGMSELLSVPYARHAETVEHNDDADADPENEIQDLKVVGGMLRITKNDNPTVIDLSQFNTDDQQLTYDEDQHILHLEDGGSVDLSELEEDGDADATNEIQTLSQVGTIVTLSQGGGTINVEDADGDPSNELQTLSQVGNTVTLSQGGGTVVIPDDDATNEIQDLSFNNNYLYITNNPDATVIDMNHFIDNTDEQQLSFDDQTATLSLQDGGVVDLSSLEDDADSDVTNELQTISRVGDDLVLSHNGGTVNIEDNDSDPANEIQTLSQVGSVVTLSNGGGTITIDDDDSNPMNEIQDLALLGDSLVISNNPFATVIDLNSIDNQSLSYNAGTRELTIDNANTVDLSDLEDDADADPNNEIQDLFKAGDSLVITNNPFATIIDLSGYMDNTDAQTLSVSGTDVSITGGNTIDMSSFMDNTDAQTLSLSNDSVFISNGNGVDLSSYLDNTDGQTMLLTGTDLSITGGNTVDLSVFMDDTDTDAQTLSLSNDSVFISNGNGVDLSSYLDNTDAQTISLAGTDLSISGGNTVDMSVFMDDTDTDAQTLSLSNDSVFISNGNAIDLSSYLDADDLGNHTATQNVVMSGHYISNDGDDEGLKILNNGNVNSSGDLFVGESAGANRDLWVSAKVTDWDNSSFFVDPNSTSVLSTVTIGMLTVTGATFNGNANMNSNLIINVAAPVAGTDAANKSYVDAAAAQDLSLAVNSLSITGDASPVDLSPYLDNTDAQTVSISSDSLFISGGNGVDLSLYLDNTDGQTMSLSNDSLTITGGNTVVFADFVRTGTAAAGDLTGDYTNLQIAAGAVGAAELDSNLAFAGNTSVTGDFTFDGALNVSGNMVTADYTAANEFIIVVDATSGNITVDLPVAASSQGRMYVIKRVDGSVNTVTIDADGAETIDGAPTQSLAVQWDYIKLVCDGNQWLVVGQ